MMNDSPSASQVTIDAVCSHETMLNVFRMKPGIFSSVTSCGWSAPELAKASEFKECVDEPAGTGVVEAPAGTERPPLPLDEVEEPGAALLVGVVGVRGG